MINRRIGTQRTLNDFLQSNRAGKLSLGRGCEPEKAFYLPTTQFSLKRELRFLLDLRII